MMSQGASTSQGLGVSAAQAAVPVLSENVSPNVRAALQEGDSSVKSHAKKDWEKETAAERLARRTKYLELANDKDPKMVSLQQQTKAMAEPIIEIEDFILYVHTFNLTGTNALQQAVYDRNIAKVKAVLRAITDRLDVLHVANRYGWEIVKLLIERRQTGEDNCLLYTSPSPRDRTRSRMPSSA